MARRKTPFDKIAEGLNEVLAIAKGEAKPAKLFVPPDDQPARSGPATPTGPTSKRSK